MVRGVSTRRKSVSRLFEDVFVPGTVFTGDSDLCKMLLASVPWMRTTRFGRRRAGFGVSQKTCICWAMVGRTFGSLRHCVEAGLFARTGSLEGRPVKGADLLTTFLQSNCALALVKLAWHSWGWGVPSFESSRTFGHVQLSVSHFATWNTQDHS